MNPKRLFLSLLLILSLVLSAPAAVTDGLVSYWPLDVNNGGSCPDAGFTNKLTIVNGVTVASGQVSNAYTFNGSSQYAFTTHGNDETATTGLPIYASANGYTICAWVKAPPVGTGGNANDKYIFTEGSTN